MAVYANEGAAILAEGIAERALDIDVVKMMGYGFPRWRGGVMKHADIVGTDKTLAAMKAADAQSPGSFRISPLLEELGTSGAAFGGWKRG